MGGTCFVEGACSGEEAGVFVVFVEGDCEDAVCGPEGLFDAVAVVDVDVNVHDARVVAEELQDTEHDIVDVAEATGLGLFGVVQATGPIDCDFGLVVAELARGIDCATSVQGTVIVESIEDGAIGAEVEAGDGVVRVDLVSVVGDHLSRHVLGHYLLEEIKVIGIVKLGHLLVCCSASQVKVHRVVHAICHDQLLGQGEAPWLHGVYGAEMVQLHSWVGMP